MDKTIKEQQCSSDTCERHVHSRGMCQKHYNYWWKHGGFNETHEYGVPTRTRLEMHSEQIKDCICWTGPTDQKGYGLSNVNGRSRRTHLISYELEFGPIPSGMTIDHLCHNQDIGCKGGKTCVHRRCMNIEHLECVDIRTNINRSPNSNAAKTHCGTCGFPFSGYNLMPRQDRPSGRECRNCANRRGREFRERRRQKIN